MKTRRTMIVGCICVLAIALIGWFQMEKSSFETMREAQPKSASSSPKRGMVEDLKVLEKARQQAAKPSAEAKDEIERTLRLIEAKVEKEQKAFDAIRSQTLAKTQLIQDLRNRLNQGLLQGDPAFDAQGLNLQIEDEAIALQELQLRLNESYKDLQTAKERVINPIVEGLLK